MTPVFFLSNPEDSSLHLIKEELENIVLLLESSPHNEKINIQWRPDINKETFSSIVRNYDHRMVLFHFAGHANSQELVFSDGSATATGIADFFKHQPYLHLVVLNGCSTASQVKRLIQNGVRAVIATSRDVPDEQALSFSQIFYQEWILNNKSLVDAYQQSINHLKLTNADSQVITVRSLVRNWSDDHRAATWNLYINGNYPWIKDITINEIISNPLVGLPPIRAEWQSKVNINRHFKGLKPFESSDAPIFFGRNQEIKNLFEFIQDENQVQVLLLYGQSGVGKSSLINAGFSPRVPSSNPVEIIQCSLINKFVDSSKSIKKSSIVIFDQAENLLRTEENSLHVLASVITENPNKIIISFRKEFLAEFSDYFQNEGILYQELFVKPLSTDQVHEIIMNMHKLPQNKKDYYFKDGNRIAYIIASKLRDSASNIAPVFQLLLSTMHKEAIADENNLKVFDEALYDRIGARGQYLKAFLDYELELLKSHPKPYIRSAGGSGLALDLLYTLTDIDHLATKELAKAELIDSYAEDENLSKIIDHLEDRYLLLKRDVEFIDKGNNKVVKSTIRLAHDTLCKEIYLAYENSKLPGQISRRILASRTKLKNEGSLLDKHELLLVRKGLSGRIKLTADEKQLVTNSQDAISSSNRKKYFLWSTIGSLVLMGVVAWFGFLRPRITQAALSNIEKSIQDREWANVRESYLALNKGRTVRNHFLQALLMAPVNCSLSEIVQLGQLLERFPSSAIETQSAKLVLAYWLSYSPAWSGSINSTQVLKEFTSSTDSQALRAVILEKLDDRTKAKLAQHFPRFTEISNIPITLAADTCTGKNILPFSVSQYEITNAQFLVYLNLSEITEEGMVANIDNNKLKLDKETDTWYTDTSYYNFPVEVRFPSAHAYCLWGGYQLPNTQQWESVARAIYPGSDNLAASQEVIDQDSERPVGNTAPNKLGVFDLLGNLSEWVICCNREQSQEIRGGNYLSGSEEVVYQNLFLDLYPSPNRSFGVGFRPVRLQNGDD